MSAQPAVQSRWFSLLRDERGYTAAEKALAAVLALGLILMVTRILLGGAATGADTVQKTLEAQGTGASGRDGSEAGSGSPGASGPGRIPAAEAAEEGGGVLETLASVGHVVLGLCSMIPVVGTPCALADTAIFVAEGDFVNAAISGVTAVPFAGTVVRGVRSAEKLAAGAGSVMRSINAEEKAATAIHRGTELASAEKNALSVTRQERQAAQTCVGPSCLCFSADTPVITPSGPQPIAQLQPGDLVLAKDENTGAQTWQPILHTFVNPDRTLLALHITTATGRDEVLRTTAAHPFFVVGRGFVPAEALRSGDELVSANEDSVTVLGSMQLRQTETVYNLEVATFHTYFVGAAQAWVHNDGKGRGCGPSANEVNPQRYDGPKPGYEVNPQHDPSKGLRPGKTPLPSDADAVFKTAVPDSATNPRNWYGMNSQGQIYRYSGSNGVVHYSGTEGVGDGIRNITDYALRRLGRK